MGLKEDLATFEVCARDEDVRRALKQWAGLKAVIEAYPAESQAQRDAWAVLYGAARAVDNAWLAAKARVSSPSPAMAAAPPRPRCTMTDCDGRCGVCPPSSPDRSPE